MIAEFESDLIRMRTREGMKVAKAKGRLGLYQAGQHTTAELAELFSVGRSTVYRAIQRAGEPGAARTRSSDSTDWGW
jgi:DNA invertase Pin-like site-specific DNA recombinase